MRGSARRSPDSVGPACVPRGLAGDVVPVHPDQEGLTLHGPLASEGMPSDTSRRPHPAQGVRPLATRALTGCRGALLPWTPARKGRTPFRSYPRMRCVVS